MLVTIFSVDELDRDERYISLFSGNPMSCVSKLETIFTEGQLANNERRGILFLGTIVIENVIPTFYLIVLLIRSDNAETEFTDDQFASGDRYKSVFSYKAITRVNNTETVFVNEQLARMEWQGNSFSKNYLILKVYNVTHIFIGHHTRRERSSIQFPRNSTMRVNNRDALFTKSQYENNDRYMLVFSDYSIAQCNSIQPVFTEEQLERYVRSTSFDGKYR